MIKYPVLLALISAASLNGQPVQFGIKGGAALLGTLPYGEDESKAYNVGPSVEFRLGKGFAIEGDALYQRVGQSSGFNFTVQSGPSIIPLTGANFSRMRGNSWQFPILAKRYLRPRSSAWQPFASLGPSIRHVGYQYDDSEIIIDPAGVKNYGGHSETGNWSIGATGAVGARLQRGRIAITPEFRFTRWAQNNGSMLSRNAAHMLVGLSF